MTNLEEELRVGSINGRASHAQLEDTAIFYRSLDAFAVVRSCHDVCRCFVLAVFQHLRMLKAGLKRKLAQTTTTTTSAARVKLDTTANKSTKMPLDNLEMHVQQTRHLQDLLALPAS